MINIQKEEVSQGMPKVQYDRDINDTSSKDRISYKFENDNPPDIKKSKDDTIDEDYHAVVERSDMKTAQRMVDEAAERAFANSKVRDEDGKLLKVYHGSDADFTVFDKTKGRANMDIENTKQTVFLFGKKEPKPLSSCPGTNYPGNLTA